MFAKSATVWVAPIQDGSRCIAALHLATVLECPSCGETKNVTRTMPVISGSWLSPGQGSQSHLEGNIDHVIAADLARSKACDECGIPSVMPPKHRARFLAAVLRVVTPHYVETQLGALDCLPQGGTQPFFGTSRESHCALQVPDRHKAKAAGRQMIDLNN